MNNRLSQLSAQYKKNSAVLLMHYKDIFYFTNADFEGFWLLAFKENTFIITSKMIEGQVKRHFKNKAKIYIAGGFFSDTLILICKEYKIKEICIDTATTNMMVFDLINTKLKSASIKVSQIINPAKELRIIKDKKEIKNIQISCRKVSNIFDKVKKKIKAGMTELDIHFMIEQEFAARHLTQSFKTIVASGPNAANPHHISGHRKILKNDIILIDMGCVYNGYCSDLTRTILFGNKQKKQQKIWSIVKQAHDKAMLSVKPGIACGTVDAAARNFIKQAGFENNFIHTTGHGVGLDIHELPSVSSKSKEILKEGMVITVEPGIYIENRFGIRIEDTVLVTKNGYKVLTSAKY